MAVRDYASDRAGHRRRSSPPGGATRGRWTPWWRAACRWSTTSSAGRCTGTPTSTTWCRRPCCGSCGTCPSCASRRRSGPGWWRSRCARYATASWTGARPQHRRADLDDAPEPADPASDFAERDDPAAGPDRPAPRGRRGDPLAGRGRPRPAVAVVAGGHRRTGPRRAGRGARADRRARGGAGTADEGAAGHGSRAVVRALRGTPGLRRT